MVGTYAAARSAAACGRGAESAPCSTRGAGSAMQDGVPAGPFEVIIRHLGVSISGRGFLGCIKNPDRGAASPAHLVMDSSRSLHERHRRHSPDRTTQVV